MPSQDFTPNNVWASATPEGAEEELTLPSGQTCRAKKMSIEAMIAAGMLAQADALTAQVNKHTRKVKGAKDGSKNGQVVVDEKALLGDTKGFQALVDLMDRSIPHIVVSPAVTLHFTETTVGKTTVRKKIAPEDRDPNLVYTDQIMFTDKTFLFDWAAGGLASLVQFRQ